MASKTEVLSSNPFALVDAGTALQNGNKSFGDQLESMVADVRALSGSWSGDAYDSAYNRIYEERDAGNRLSDEVVELADVMINAGHELCGWRDSAIAKLRDAEAAGCVVADDWSVSHEDAAVVEAHQGQITSAALGYWNAASDAANAISCATVEVRGRGDQIGDGDDLAATAASGAGALGREDGEALADYMSLPPAERDSSTLERIAGQLPTNPLTKSEIGILAAGGQVDSLPPAVQDYYREFYNSAGKDGVLELSEHLKAEEAAGTTTAAAQRDALANGLAVVSNEEIGTGRDDAGNLTGAGSYGALPSDLREVIEARRSDPTWPNQDTLGPTEAKNQHVGDVVKLADLIGEANPGYEPGGELGAQLYLKSADMVSNSDGGWGMTDFDLAQYDGAAGGLAEFAGRNDDAAYRIWSGDGMPQDYDAKETVHALTTHDWSDSDQGRGAATLLDRIAEESQLPPDDPRGVRGRESLVEMADMFAPAEGSTFNDHRDAFARSPELSTAMSSVMSSNLDAVSSPGYRDGFTVNEVTPEGVSMLRASQASDLLELASYSEEGRTTLSTAIETRRVDELTDMMQRRPDDDLSSAAALSDAGPLSGRADKAMYDALVHADQLTGESVANPDDAVFRAKMLGAQFAGELADAGVGTVPGSDYVTGVTGADVGGYVSDRLQTMMGKPEYEYMTRPDPEDLTAQANENAQSAIMRAAYQSGELPYPLTSSGTGLPLTPGDIRHDASALTRLNEYVEERGLSQYMVDYVQSYEAKQEES